MKFIVIIGQILFIHVFLFIGMAIKLVVPVPIPASMIGLIILLVCLLTKIVKIEWVEKGAAWLLAELLLFFIPSAVGIVNYEEILNMKGIETILLIAVSTFVVMLATGFTAEKIYNRKRRFSK
ncbi:CidA/LrgA family protein [Niallia sp. 01092]|uniref:CidA/LrgA family protein n=1 Tax=unclassified Niallia TaxID=2837522 RepID=UPI003FD08891